MAASNYRQLHTRDEEATEHDAHSLDAETSHDSMYDYRSPSLHVQDQDQGQDQAGYDCHDSHSSEATPQINILADEDRLCRRPDPQQHGIPLLSDADISDSTTSVETRDDEPTNISRRLPDQSAQHMHPTWTDFYFSPLFLISLSVLFILMIAALEVLHYVSQRDQGLVTASEDMHYVWTYGPTFVLTMILALWGQLELRAMQIIPWCLMSSGEASAENSLMLNYITSSTLGSLVRSFKRKHFLVSIGICGSLILRLMIIFASGLLRLEYRSLAYGKDLRVEDIFDLTNISWETVPVTGALNYWATLNYGLPYPHGTTSQFAVQSFTSGDDMYDQLTGEVQVFESSLENCWPFSFTYKYGDLLNPDTSDPTLPNADRFGIPLEMATPASLMEDLRPWCYASHVNLGNTDSVGDGLLQKFLNLTQLIYKCTNSTPVEDQEHRILFTMEYQLSNETEASGIMCEPKYSLTRRAVTNKTQPVGVQDDLNIAGPIMETLDMEIRPLNMTAKILRSLGDERATDVLNLKWNVWYTMLNISQPQTNLWSFRNTSLVIELSQRIWKGVAAYVVKHDYTSPSNETINGTATSVHGRLCVQELSLRLVEAHITLLFGLIVALCFVRPGVFYRDPASLGTHSMILARSPRLRSLIQGYGAASKRALRARLSGYLASFPQNLPPANPAIVLNHYLENSESMSEKSRADRCSPREWWSPVSVRWWFRICLMTVILAAVIVLEILLQVSNQRIGLGNVSLDGYLKYTWSFLPTLVLVLIGLLFSMVDSTARTLFPFQMLRKGRAAMEDLLYDPVRQVSLVAVCHAAWNRRFVLLWATLPGLLGPILTIISSGLYTVAPVPWTYDVELELRDWFRPENRTVNIANTVEGDSDEAWTIFKLMQFSNMSSPRWTQGKYALASFGAENLRSRDGNDTSLHITARVPTTRVNLNCSLAGHYDNDTFLYGRQDPGSRWLPIDPRPSGCHTPPEWNQTTGQRDLYLSRTSYFKNVDGTKQTRGYYLSLLQDGYDSFVLDGLHYIEPTTSIRVCGDARQHYFFGVGYGQGEMTVLHCTPYVEALWVTAAFTLPDLSLVNDVPVAPDEESAVFLSDSASMTAFRSSNWEDVVVAVVDGSSGVGQPTRLSSDPDSNYINRLLAAVESTLAEYFAQVLHSNYRQPVGVSTGQDILTPDGQPATGTVTDRTRLRVIQNKVSTRILQGLLVVMGACLVASTALGRGARVIPRDPGSIASRMAYFADGEIWQRVPVGADRWTDEQIKKHGLGISEGRLLLSWWGGYDREDSQDPARGKRFAVDVTDCKEAA